MSGGTEPKFRRKLKERDLVRMMVPERHWTVKYSQVPESIRGKIKTYFAELDQMMGQGIGLMLWGENGRGKTCAATVAMLEARRRGFTGLFLPAADMKTIVVGKSRFDEDQTIWERAKSVDFLVIDDLGKGVQDQQGFGERLLDELVRTRSAALKATWITMNMNPAKFREEYKLSTFEALREVIVPVRVSGENQRQETGSDLQQLFGRGV